MKNWEEIEELFNENQIDVLKTMEDYSGRAMFGDTTVGFKLDFPNFKQACIMLNNKEIPYSTDSMGFNYIIY